MPLIVTHLIFDNLGIVLLGPNNGNYFGSVFCILRQAFSRRRTSEIVPLGDDAGGVLAKHPIHHGGIETQVNDHRVIGWQATVYCQFHP
jgi:hypothetical protein